MGMAVIKAAAYSLVHAPDLALHGGTTPVVERRKNPGSEFLKKLPSQLRSFDAAAGYPPNQVYIGNLRPEDLAGISRPWYENRVKPRTRGEFGDIIPQEVFYVALKHSDTFGLIYLEDRFLDEVGEQVQRLLGHQAVDRVGGTSYREIESFLAQGGMGLYLGERLVGCVRRAHELDPTLDAHVILENLAAKASGVVALQALLDRSRLPVGQIDYIIETSEAAVGDMNQRGGGNLAKAIGETAGCVNATGSDLRAFCAAPAHGLVVAAGLVQAGIYRNVAVVAGGALAKLAMNAREHVARGLPVLEDMLGAFAILVGPDDGKNPVLRADLVGRHRIGSGAAPQAVIQALVLDPLDRAGWKLSDVQRYAVEMQNPEITEPAGAGDVPRANYKMIAAVGVKRGKMERGQIDEFVRNHGMPGFAPTQGHIPSGVPYVGHARREIMAGNMERVMIVGKGSLFLGRMTGLFDGVSFIIESNQGEPAQAGDVREEVRRAVAQAMRSLARELAGDHQ
ncbi:MAG: glycine/sarcosine/betaine reductase complex component C subunit beta [Bacillota bacterium]